MSFEIKHISYPKKKRVTTDTAAWAKRLAELAQKGAALGKDCGKMCKDCAFRYDQEHNSDYLDAVDGALQMLASEGKFHCHNDDHTDAGKPCAGFEYAKAYFENLQ